MNRAYRFTRFARFGSVAGPDADPSRVQIGASLLPMAAFYSVLAGIIALGLYVIRMPLGGPSSIVFVLYWLEASALIGAVTIAATVRQPGYEYLACVLFILFIFLVSGMLPFLAWLLMFPAAATVLLIFICAARANRSGFLAIVVMLATPPLAASYFFQMNSMVYGSVFLPELVLSGSAYPDTLFHTALSSMIAWHGKIASALDGFAPLRYHIFSHLWFGLTAKSAGINVVHGYYLGMQILGLPLLLFGLGFATLAFTPRLQNAPATALPIVVPLAVLCVFDRFDWMSYLVSESHMVGLLLFLIGLPYLRSLANESKYSIPELVCGLAYGILLTTAKISVGAAWTAPFLYIMIRSGGLSNRGYVVVAIMLALQAYLVLAFTLPNDNVLTTAFDPLHFFRSFPIVALTNIAPIGVAAFFCIQELRRDKCNRWAEASLLTLLISVLPTLLFRIEGGSAYYFVNIGTWFGIASVSGRIIAWSLPRNHVPALAISVACIVVAIALHPEKMSAYDRLKQQRDALYRRLDPTDSISISSRSLYDRAALKALASASMRSTGAKIGTLLAEAKVSASTNAIVMVAPEFEGYWALTPRCNIAPFLIPAYFGLPLLKGLPPIAETCDLGTYYGYRLYGAESHSTDLDDSTLCEQAHNKGFGILVILRSDQKVTRLDCATR